jgi:SAM-dependent methyltransferase
VKSVSVAPYELLSRYYDRVFIKDRHPYLAVRHRLLRTILPRARAACDLACGTGTTALEFARQGLEVFAVDGSPAMCRVARRKVREAKLPVHVLRADMRSFRLPREVDLVTCEFDALNHLARPGDLSRVAAAVARALGPGGHFLFDVNTPRSFEKLWPLSWYTETRDFVLATHGGEDRRRKTAWNKFEWFLPEGRTWRRLTETYKEVCWPDSVIRRALRRAGFARIRSWDAAQLFGPAGPLCTRPGLRTYYLARKASGRR